ncbi:MAG: hypothetical protein Q9208_006547 [Pyrenodesmia sp. 3 TL-2023]
MAKGTQSTRTIKKNNPFSGGRSREFFPGKQQMKSVDSPRSKDAPRATSGSSSRPEPVSRDVPLASRTEHRTFYDDPVSVRQWAAETDPNASVDFTEHGLQDASFGADAANVCYASQYQGSFPVSYPGVSHVPFPVTNGFQGEDFSAACTYPDPSGMAQNFGDALGLETYCGSDSMKNYDAWAYPTPTAEDMTYSTSTMSGLPYSGDGSAEPRFSDWSTGLVLSGNETCRENILGGSQPLAWSPILATDPSVSSSYSRGSYLPMQINTPLSPVAQEADWPMDLPTCLEETAFYPAFSLGEPSQAAAYPPNHQDPMRWVYNVISESNTDDQRSTVKPSRSFQRAPLPGMDLWTQEDSQNQAHNSPAFVDLTHTRRSSDVETTTTAREHPLYQVGPKEDGLYHCPFAGSEDCSHKPEKLKCNYE